MSSRKMRMAVTNGAEPSVVALDTKVGILEEEVNDINVRITALDTNLNNKMDRMATAVTSELKALSAALADKNKTPWGILISGAGVVITVVALLGHQALSPIQDTLKLVSDNIVPRKEIELRYEVHDRRITSIEGLLLGLQKWEGDALRSTVDALERENRLLRGTGKP